MSEFAETAKGLVMFQCLHLVKSCGLIIQHSVPPCFPITRLPKNVNSMEQNHQITITFIVYCTTYLFAVTTAIC